MRINEQLLDTFFAKGKGIRRKGWPKGDYILADVAVVCMWHYTDAEDAFSKYTMDFTALGADDWGVM